MNERIAQLYKLGNPRDLKEETNSIGWHDCLQYGFTEEDIPELISLLTNKSLDESEDEMEMWAPLYAWRTLGQLGAVEAVEPLISLLNYWIDIDNDWGLTEVIDVMGMIGATAINPLTKFMLNDENREYARNTIPECLEKIVEYDPECRNDVIEQFRLYTSAPNVDLGTLNGLLICSLVDLKAVELIDDIRNMFQQGYVDITVAGDLEDVEIELGLRTERETPKPNYNMFSEDLSEKLFGGEYESEEWSASPAQHYGEDTYVREEPKIGRNDPCPCGSGKKYKKCCLN